MNINKYRLWCTQTKEFIDQRYFCLDGLGDIFIIGSNARLCRADSGRFLLSMLTGLYDKNGKEIYKDDIIFEPLNNINGLITYRRGAFGFEFNNKKQWLSFTSCPDLQVTIIGNIYEHKHLLEETK